MINRSLVVADHGTEAPLAPRSTQPRLLLLLALMIAAATRPSLCGAAAQDGDFADSHQVVHGLGEEPKICYSRRK